MTQETFERNLKALRDFAANNVRSLLKLYDVDEFSVPATPAQEASGRRRVSQSGISPWDLRTSTAGPSLCT
jgi:hypothetical protein